jgi:hypothetical protein
MDATMPELPIDPNQVVGSRLQLKPYKPDPWAFNQPAYKTEPTTPSEWFGSKFQDQAKIHGCPFLEHVETLADGTTRINPIAPNIDFLAAILGGDVKLGQKVVYIESEMQFFYYDCRDRVYKATSEDKLGNLMRAFLIRCAEELPNNVHKANLFYQFRNDKMVRSIIHRAKSILAADDSYFSVESKHQRQQGPELYERVARAFVEQVLERQAGEILTVNDAYVHFCDYLSKRKMPPVNRKVFKHLVPPVVKEQFDLGIRNDLQDQTGDKWQRGWKGIGILESETAVPEN